MKALIRRKFSTTLRSAHSKKILEGYRVIDASRILVGAFGSMMLADMGAEVIKIEQLIKGDETRDWGPPFLDTKNSEKQNQNMRKKDSTYFMSLNRNKKSIAIDLKNP